MGAGGFSGELNLIHKHIFFYFPNNLEGANIECIGKNISNSINTALNVSFNLMPLTAPRKAKLTSTCNSEKSKIKKPIW